MPQARMGREKTFLRTQPPNLTNQRAPETGTSAEAEAVALAEPLPGTELGRLGNGRYGLPACLPAWHNGIQGMHQAKKTKK